MTPFIKSLEKTNITTIHKTFLESFSDYQVDVSYMTLNVMKKRFLKNGYQPAFSTGLFDGDHLCGFTIVGTGNFYGRPAAFDIMTGMVKSYRGQGFAAQMFEQVKEKILGKAIRNFYLEVLQENEPAIRSYSKSGFAKQRGLNCYILNKHYFRTFKSIQTVVHIDHPEFFDFDSKREFFDWEPSWENHPESIKRCIQDVEIIEAKHFGTTIGLLVYHPVLKWILCLAVDPGFRRKGVATSMLEYLIYSLPGHVQEIKILNVDEKDAGMNLFLKNCGFKFLTGQFEMRYTMN